jgi:cobalt-zinc-cadmium efflux system membrane fusion protein
MKQVVLRSSIAAGLLSCAAWGLWHFRHDSAPEVHAEENPPAERNPLEVVLPPEKYAQADLKTVPAARRIVRQMRRVPGQIDYNGLRRVEIKSPVDSVVREVHVKPGDPVKTGTRLASLESAEIGQVRAEVEKNEAELRIANQACEFADEIASNLDDLLRGLRNKPDPNAIESAFEGKLLGDHRQAIVSAYSRYILADELWTDLQPLVKSGSVASQVAKQRETNRQVTKEDYLSICEQSRFDARQNREKARAKRDFTRRLVDVSRQKLKTLLGAFSEVADTETDRSGEGNDLTRYYLIAPFEGTVEQRHVSRAQRLSLGMLAFVVANTETLWITADIRERDWRVLSVHENDPLKVRVPALDDREFDAHVDFVGREVEPVRMAVPLIAVISNEERLLRPGMFAWVSLPAGAGQEALAVPPAAIQTHDGRKFVFVEIDPQVFRRVDVTVGAETPEWVTIERGLTAGQNVVTHGAFLLKSELLLEREGD